MAVKDSELRIGKVFYITNGPYTDQTGTLQGYTKDSVLLSWPGAERGLWFLKDNVEATASVG